MKYIYEEVPVFFIEDCKKVTGRSCTSTNFKECVACNEIGYNCVNEAIDFMVEKGYDVLGLSEPYMSDITHQNVMWVKAVKM